VSGLDHNSATYVPGTCFSQIIPEELERRLDDPSILQSEDAQRIKHDYYDPTAQNPIALFDPRIAIPMGALMDRKVTVDPDEDVDTECVVPKTQCTWENLWRRRLCVFNTGTMQDGDCPYARSVWNGTNRTPGAASFWPVP